MHVVCHRCGSATSAQGHSLCVFLGARVCTSKAAAAAAMYMCVRYSSAAAVPGVFCRPVTACGACVAVLCAPCGRGQPVAHAALLCTAAAAALVLPALSSLLPGLCVRCSRAPARVFATGGAGINTLGVDWGFCCSGSLTAAPAAGACVASRPACPTRARRVWGWRGCPGCHGDLLAGGDAPARGARALRAAPGLGAASVVCIVSQHQMQHAGMQRAGSGTPLTSPAGGAAAGGQAAAAARASHCLGCARTSCYVAQAVHVLACVVCACPAQRNVCVVARLS